jgi:hypothetical protein
MKNGEKCGWTMAEAAALSGEVIPGAYALHLHLECGDGRAYSPVAPWAADPSLAVGVALAFCAHHGLTPVRLSPVVSYDPGQLPYLVRGDLSVSFPGRT